MAADGSTMDRLTEYLELPFPGLDDVQMPPFSEFLQTEMNYFNPVVVSIGPNFHHLPLCVENVVKLKMACDLIEPESFSIFNSNMEALIEEGMGYYPKTIVDEYIRNLNMDVTIGNRIKIFRIIFFLDACFIVRLIELVVGGKENELPFPSIIRRRCCRDLMLLENQIPWVVLKGIFEAKYGSTALDMITIYGQLNCFANLLVYGSTDCSAVLDLSQRTPVHLLDIVRLKVISFVFPDQNHNTVKGRDFSFLESVLASASQLRKRWGITFALHEFRRNLEVSRIEFKLGCLYLPSLIIGEYFENLYMNLVAHEDALLDGNCEISSLIWLMAVLMSDEQSVGILREEIVSSDYSNAEIVEVFKRFGHIVLPNMKILERLVEPIEIYQQKSCMMFPRKWLFEIKDTCFGMSRVIDGLFKAMF